MRWALLHRSQSPRTWERTQPVWRKDSVAQLRSAGCTWCKALSDDTKEKIRKWKGNSSVARILGLDTIKIHCIHTRKCERIRVPSRSYRPSFPYYILNKYKSLNIFLSGLNKTMDGQGGSASEGMYQGAWWPEFNPWGPHSGRKRMVLTNCPLTSTMHCGTHPDPSHPFKQTNRKPWNRKGDLPL